MSKTITIFDGIEVHTSDEVQTVKGPRDLWELFGWDIDNDSAAKECANIITRQLFCFGHIDLSSMNHGNTLYLRAIPAKNNSTISE